MAKLYFRHAVMNSGKSLHLLQVNHNYRSENARTLLFSHAIDNRYGENIIASRLGGISAPCVSVDNSFDLFEYVKIEHERAPVKCILVDEVQFYSRKQIVQLSDIVDYLGVSVIAYGLKVSALGVLFEGSQALLELADSIEELRQVCHCGRKANMILKYNTDGSIVREGGLVEVGAESRYRSVCRRHWKEGNLGPNFPLLS